jgi:hypothetical protein
MFKIMHIVFIVACANSVPVTALYKTVPAQMRPVAKFEPQGTVITRMNIMMVMAWCG